MLRRVPILAISLIALPMIMACTGSGSDTPRPPTATPRSQGRIAQPTVDPTSKRWEDFNRYGPQLGEIIDRSDRFTNRVTAGISVGAPRPDLFRLVDEAAEMNGLLKGEVQRINVPTEGRAVKDAVYEAVRARETALNRQKDAMNRPSPEADTAYNQAREAADRRAAQIGITLLELCQTMQSPIDECFPVVGIMPAT